MAWTKASGVGRASHVLEGRLDGQTILFQPLTGEYAGLDGTAARVWELLAGPTTFGGLVDTLTGEYDVSRGECARDVVRCLEDLRRHGVVALGRGGGGSGNAN
jgi:hypothetical protein